MANATIRPMIVLAPQNVRAFIDESMEVLTSNGLRSSRNYSVLFENFYLAIVWGIARCHFIFQFKFFVTI